MISSCSLAQRTSIGFFFGQSVGYSSVYSHNVNNVSGLLDINFQSEESFFTTIQMLNDGDLSNNIEAMNGAIFGIRANLSIVKGLSIQPEIEYQQSTFNHILYQNGLGVFNELDFALMGLENNGQYKISNYYWKVNYLNFPFVLKLYPTKNLFFQAGVKFGFLLKAEETPVLGAFNINNEQYTEYEVLFSERVVYEFFDSNSGMDSHGFDKSEWPFNWNLSIIGGLGYETKTFYFSIRYTLGLLDFFREIDVKDDDFFDIYNTDINSTIYESFEILDPVLNNNFKLHTIHFTIGCNLSN